MTHELDNPETAARCQEENSGRICSPSDDQQITRHLAELQAHIDRMPGDNRPQNPADDSANLILSKLDRQTVALETLSGGLDQMHRQIATRVIDAIKELNLCVPAVSPVEPDSSVSSAVMTEESVAPVTAQQPADDIQDGKQDDKSVTTPNSVETSWDQIRQSFLESTEEESAPAPEPVAPTSSAEEPADTNSESESAADTSAEPLEPLKFEVPAPFDCSTIEDEVLRAVFLEREEILRLMSLHLLQQPQLTAAIPADQLREIGDTLPADLRNRVELSLSRLDEQHRLTELELSLERARMARQKTSLEETRCRLENTARQMGYTVLEDGTLDGAQEVDDNTPGSGRRWTKVLGFGR